MFLPGGGGSPTFRQTFGGSKVAQRNALSRGVAQQQTALAACGTGSLVSGAEGLMTLNH